MYSRPRLIPCLLLKGKGLYKTKKFSNPRYLGDPINGVKMFNGKEVDELCLLNIEKSLLKEEPDFDLLKAIASQAFMPLSYGGGLTNTEQLKKLFFIGFEKAVINTAFVENPSFISEAAKIAGSSSIVVSIDVKREIFGKKQCYSCDGTKRVKKSVLNLAKLAEELGAGELLLNSINCDGMMEGYDLELVKEVAAHVKIPLIASGGAKDMFDQKKVLEYSNAHAAAAGSMYVYYGKQKAVLINAPTEEDLIINKIIPPMPKV